MSIWFWIWLVAAVTLSIAEIFTAGFFLLPFGLGAALAATLAWFHVDLGWQWIVFIGSSVALLFGLRRFASAMTHDPPQQVAGDRLLGRQGVVISRIDEHHDSGRVIVEREEWRATAPQGIIIEEGARVTVTRVEGAHLVVEPA